MSIFTIVILFSGFEIYVFSQIWSTFGFINMCFALLLSGFLGMGLVRTQSKVIVQSLQETFAKSKMPSDQVLHRLLILIAGLLFVVPGFLSDVLAFLLIIPGTRHLAVYFFKKRFKESVKNGQFRVFTGNGFGGFATVNTDIFRSGANQNWGRDVSPKIIDVIPIASEESSVVGTVAVAKDHPGGDNSD